MPLNSVNTNIGAMVALQSLNKTNDDMAVTQKRISTGLRVADAKDDGAAFAVAQKVRANVAGLTSANEQLGGAKGVIDTTLSSLNAISSKMGDIQKTLVKLADAKVTGEERAAYGEQFQKQVAEVDRFIMDSTYNGYSLLNSTTARAGITEGSITTVRNETGGTFTISEVANADALTFSAAANPATAASTPAVGTRP
jgi:flagellin